MTKFINAKMLYEAIQTSSGITIVDVRPTRAYEKWKIEGKYVTSFNLQFLDLKQMGDKVQEVIPSDFPIVTVCEQGHLAVKAADVLASQGYEVTVLKGGMEAWSSFYETREIVSNERLQLYQIIRPAKGCLSYIVISRDEAVIVDPSRHLEFYKQFVAEKEVTIRHIIDTHLHADHISGGYQLAAETGADYWIATEEMHSSARPYQALPDRKELLLGNGELHFMSYFTPGHTVASTSILIDNQYLLSGDAIFVNGIGRPDLKGQAKVMANKMFETIQQLNKDISEKCLILPGHYASQEEINEQGFIGATYGDIQQCVHLLKVNDRQVFVTETLQNLGDTPPNFEKITKINQGKVVVDEQEQSLLEIGPNLCAVSNVG